MKDQINLPINLLASAEEQAAWDREDGITDRSKQVIIRKLKVPSEHD